MQTLIERELFPRLLREINRDNITAITGPRRVGKTTLLIQIKEKLLKNSPVPSIVDLNFDRLEHREIITSSYDALEKYIENSIGIPLSKLEHKIYLIIDEAQKAKSVFERVKILYDNFKGKIKIILTGSSTLELLDFSVETLAGRIHYCKVSPFTLKETLVAKNIISSNENGLLENLLTGQLKSSDIREKEIHFHKKREQIMSVLEDSLIWGTFPELCFFEDQEDKLLFLANYKETYLEKDIRQLEYIQNLGSYSHLLELLADNNGSVFQYNQLTNDLNISFPTLKKYISLIEATFLNFSLYPFSQSQRRRIIKAPKHYYIDNGLVSYLSDFYDYEGLSKSGRIGARFESFFINQIRIKTQLSIVKPSLFFWRTTGGIEIDLVLKAQHKIMPIEFKYSSVLKSSSSRNLSHFMDIFPERTNQGVVVYNGDFEQVKDKDIFFIPAYILF